MVMVMVKVMAVLLCMCIWMRMFVFVFELGVSPSAERAVGVPSVRGFLHQWHSLLVHFGGLSVWPRCLSQPWIS